MNTGKIILYGSIITILLALPAIGMGIALVGQGTDNQGETIANGTAGGSSQLSDAVPAALVPVFQEPLNNGVITPPALLAAISSRECKPLWDTARKNPEVIRLWQGPVSVDERGCGAKENGSGALGPMQFLIDPFTEVAAATSAITKHTPALRQNLRDAVHAAAIKLRRQSSHHYDYLEQRKLKKKPVITNPKNVIGDWKETDIYWAAYHYQGNCGGGYCDEIIANWKRFSQIDSAITRNDVPVFHQTDPRWAEITYGFKGQGTIGSSGCGPTAAAIVLKFYGKDVTPQSVAAVAAQQGYRVSCGTSHAFFPYIAEQHGLKSKPNIGWSEVITELRAGRPVILSGRGSRPFSRGGHFIVATNINDDGTIGVNDPAGRDGDYEESILKDQFRFATVIYQ